MTDTDTTRTPLGPPRIPTPLPPAYRIKVVPWPDPVTEAAGFPTNHPYLELCWTPVLGPSSILALRRLAGLASRPGGAEVIPAQLGADLGLPGGGVNASLSRTLTRLCQFGMARWTDADTLAVRVAVPPLPTRRLGRLGRAPMAAHRRFMETKAPPENPLLDAALSYAGRGWPVFPLRPGAKEPDGRQAPRGLLDATTEPDRIRAWWASSPRANVGLRTGEGIDVIDVDGPRSLLDDLGGPPVTPGALVSTGRGWHLYFASSGLPTRAGVVPGVDVRGAGGYVVAPPSLHPSGRAYRFIDPGSGETLGRDEPGLLPPAPEWIRALLRPAPPASRPPFGEPRRVDTRSYAAAALADECVQVAATPPGSRNDRLNRAAFAMGTLVGAGALDPGGATHSLVAAAGRAGLGETEAARTVASGLAAGIDRPRQLADGEGPATPPVRRSGGGAAGVLESPAPPGPRPGLVSSPSSIARRGRAR